MCAGVYVGVHVYICVYVYARTPVCRPIVIMLTRV